MRTRKLVGGGGGGVVCKQGFIQIESNLIFTRKT